MPTHKPNLETLSVDRKLNQRPSFFIEHLDYCSQDCQNKARDEEAKLFNHWVAVRQQIKCGSCLDGCWSDQTILAFVPGYGLSGRFMAFCKTQGCWTKFGRVCWEPPYIGRCATCGSNITKKWWQFWRSKKAYQSYRTSKERQDITYITVFLPK